MPNMNKNVRTVLWASLLLATALPGPAKAYGPEGMFGGRLSPDNTIVLDNPVQIDTRPQRAQSVLQHPRPDYDPVPVMLGTFELFPSVEAGYAYDSNVFALHENAKDDHIATLRPSASVFSNWNRHAVAATAFGDLNFYKSHQDENFNNFVTGIEGRYDIMPETWLSSRVGYQHLSEPRSSPDSVNGSEPTNFNVARGGLSFYRGIGKVKLNTNYDLTRYIYNDTPSSTGMIDNSHRDRTQHEIGPKITYDMTENFKPYVKATHNWRIYDNNHTRQSDGYSAVAGVTADFGGITSADVFAGWMSQNFDNSLLDDKTNDALKIGGRLEWNVTGLTTLVLETDRTIEETTMDNFNSYIATGGSATLTHELRRNILLEADFAFTRDDYHGLGSRADDNLSTGAGVRWLINRYLYSDLVYSFNKRMSDDSASDYNRHIVTVRVGAQM